jgi:pseudouridylate synthase
VTDLDAAPAGIRYGGKVADRLDPAWHDQVLAEGLSMVERDRIVGKDVTSYLLTHSHSATGGESLAANIRIILRNALAARVPVALVAPTAPAGYRRGT